MTKKQASILYNNFLKIRKFISSKNFVYIKRFKFLLICAVIIIFGAVFINPLQKIYHLLPFLEYPDGYKSMSVKTGGGMITFINDESDVSPYSEMPCINLGSNITVFLSRPWRQNQTYKIKSNSYCVFNDSFYPKDVDGDGNDEIWSEWIITAGGSGASRAIVIWNVESGILKPKYKFARELTYNNKEHTVILSNSKGDQEFDLFVLGSDAYYQFKSKDGNFYLDIASFIWNFDEGESHFSAHGWRLSRYILSEDTFVRDKIWNKGEDYITKDKLEIDDNLHSSISSIFESI